ncbi:hypothetical protein PH586_03670 [Pseudomonas sp. SA3-5]|uniref:Uncharacterized protein n=1 Tax=Pseudomonas aestuarii TaxID=3018340 RepID=A0ABT4XAS3_9PSED|nr:hypothetical protein [Pseudomonas aestuarii]MDA7085490.1 hypothetical protein [Pseudomonas aestuarii]
MNNPGQESTRADLEHLTTLSETVKRHRRDIRRALDQVRAMLEQMGTLTPSPAVDDSATSALRMRLEHAMSLPRRASIIKDLSIALRELISLERQSYGLDAPRVVVMPVKAAKDGEG